MPPPPPPPPFDPQDEAVASRTKIDIKSSHIDTSVFKAVLELQDVAGRDRFKDAAAIDKVCCCRTHPVDLMSLLP